MIRLVVTALCAAGLVGPSAGSTEPAKAVALPAVVSVSTSWQGWVRDERTGEVFGGTKGYRYTAACSGTVVDGDGLVATAGACVDDGKNGLLDLAVAELVAVGRVRDRLLARRQLAEHAVVEGARTDSPVERRVQVTRDGDSVPATVATQGDVALLQVAWRGLPAIEVATGDVPVGASVLVLGQVADGSMPIVADARVTRRHDHFFEIDTPAANGGPVVDLRGRLVGVISEDMSVSAAPLGRDVGLGPVDRDYRTGLDAYFAGDYDRAVEYLDAVLGAAPGNKQARQYRDRAVALGGTAASSGLLIVFIVVCGAIAMGAGGAGMVRAARRRRADMVTPPYGLPMEPRP
jgi:serine protease Do